jgi:acylphosphatase
LPRRETVRVSIAGRVQGVGYRAWLAAKAQACGLDGWVRNRPDGGVEALPAGDPDRIAAIVALCHAGPALARVDAVIKTPTDEDAGSGFSIRP